MTLKISELKRPNQWIILGFPIMLFLNLISMSTFSQAEDYKKIATALSTADIEALVDYAPDKNHGTVQFSTPGLAPRRLDKTELSGQLTKFFQTKTGFEYEQLFNDKVQHLPLIVGKLSNGKQKEYVMIGMADFGGFYRYLSFRIMKELPSNMRHLDKK